jgi:membrane fusion protein (multidrug efflux system)
LRLAEQELARLQSVTVPGAVAQSDVDAQLAARSSAAASLRLAQAQLAKAELELGYTRVEAPLSGYVGKALREIGSFVDEGQNSLLAVMQQVEPLYVSFAVSERQYLDWRRAEAEGRLVRAGGDSLPVSLRLLDGTTLPNVGAINFESADVDTGTGTIEFRASFDNTAAGMKPGQFVKVVLNGYARPDVVAVPQRAVGQSPQGAYVYVVNAQDTAELRPIQPGAWSGDQWIVESGLEAGERVVVEGLTKVQPGLPVRPVPADAAPAPSGE